MFQILINLVLVVLDFFCLLDCLILVVQICSNLELVVLDFLPLGMPHFSNLDLQQFSEEETSNENARNALIDANEEEAIRDTTKALNDEDAPTPSKGGNASTPPKMKKCSAKKRTK
jgi:hypothetical protein